MTARFTIAATGRLSRWLPAQPTHGPAAAAVAGYGKAAADVILLALLASQLATAPATVAPLPIAATAAASLTRLTLASTSRPPLPHRTRGTHLIPGHPRTQ